MKKNTCQKVNYSLLQNKQDYTAPKISLKGIGISNIYFVNLNTEGNIANQPQFKELNNQIEQNQTILEIKIVNLIDTSLLKIEQLNIYETILEKVLEISVEEQNKKNPIQQENLKKAKFSKKQNNLITEEQSSYDQEISLINFQKRLKAFQFNQSLQLTDLIYLSQCNLQNLQNLNFEFQIFSSQDIPALNQTFKNFQNLNRLVLSLTSDNNQEINKNFIDWKNIEQLNALNIAMPSIFIPNFLQDLNDLPQLKYFRLNIFYRLDEKQAETLGQYIQKMQILEKFDINLNDCYLREEITQNIFKGFQNQKNLNIFLNNENLNQNTINNILSAKFNNLQILNIYFKQQYLSFESIKILKDNLIALQTLKTLNISCDQTNTSLFYLILHKINHPSLSLNLGNVEFNLDLSNFYLQLDLGTLTESQFDQEGNYLFQQLFSQLDQKVKRLSLIFGYLDMTNNRIQIIAQSLMLLKNLTNLPLDFFWNFKINYSELAESISQLKNLNQLHRCQII
ncbi:hypothetical protein ABPG72_021834 [Tetrahymena utriculariae]